MKRYIPWLGLGLFAAALGGSTFACSSSDSGGGGGTGAGTVGGAGGGGGNIVGGAGGAGGAGGSVTGGAGGTAGTGGATTQTKLGAKCTKDAECGTGLTCLLPNGGAMDGEGPAKGYCSTECSGDATVCGQFGANVACLSYDNGKAYCMEGCTFGPETQSAFDPKKCHGRPDVACSGLLGSEVKGDCTPAPAYDCPKGEACANDNKCHTVIPACLPRCNSDTECGTGLKCNPQSGLCTSQALTGKDLGEACVVADPDAGTSDCKGVCINFGDDLRSCGSACTIGANPSCGWSGTGPAPSYCLYASSVVADNGGPGVGDLGLCIQFCDCDSDCKTPGLKCHDFGTSADATSIKNFVKRKGACFNPKGSDGGIDPGIPSCTASDAGTGGGGGTGGGTSDASTD
ncbi:MAG: hypothetical protein IPI67_18690 [Myxococcales bacterium]|nr:hypothetical protein [Myxococcales bacterium]